VYKIQLTKIRLVEGVLINGIDGRTDMTTLIGSFTK